MTALIALRELAAQPLWRRWTLASFLARLPLTMTLLALLYVGRAATGSLATGAQLAGLAIFVAGLSATWRGRQLDRVELRGGLQRSGLATAAVLSAEAMALAAGASLWTLFVLAGLQGVAQAPLQGGYRALLPVAVARRDLVPANALDAVAVEVAFITGPPLAGILVTVVGPVGVLLTMAGFLLASAVVAAGLPPLLPPAERQPFSPWRAPGVTPIYLLALTLGACFGLFESAVPARVEVLGSSAAAAGLLLALVAVGSVFGGLYATASADRDIDPRRQALVLLALLGVALLPTAAMPSLAALGAVLFVVGVPVAPLNALGTRLIQQHVPAGRQGEGFSVYLAAILLGAGLGNSITGQLLEAVGPRGLLVIAAILPLGAAAVLLAPRAP